MLFKFSFCLARQSSIYAHNCHLVTSVNQKPKIQSESATLQKREIEPKASNFKFKVNGVSHQKSLLYKNSLPQSKESVLSSSHIYQELCPWKTKYELASYLQKNQIYFKDGLLVINKPYGISKVPATFSSNKNKNQVQIQNYLNSDTRIDYCPSLTEALPILQEMFELKHLEIVKMTERWSSGVTILSSSPEVSKKVQKCIRHSKSIQVPPLVFWTLCMGKPKPSSQHSRVGITLEQVDAHGKVPVIVSKFSNSRMKVGDVKSCIVKYRTISQDDSSDTSLVEISTLTERWHFIRVFLANCYSPVLGDKMYSGRVKVLKGQKLLVSPHNDSAYQPLDLTNALATKLELENLASELIPCHIHLREVCLHQFNTDKSDLVLRAEPPSFFNWTCQKLNIVM